MEYVPPLAQVCEDPEFLHRSARTREGWAGLNRSRVRGGMSGAAVAAGCVAKEAFPLAVLLPRRVAKSAGLRIMAGVGVTVEAPPGALAGLGESERKPCSWRCSECALCVSWGVPGIPL